MVEILVPLGFFSMIVGIVYIQARKKVHLTLIQQRVDASTLKTDKDANGALKFGMLMVGVAVGILSGNYLSHFMQTEAAFFSMVLIFGGISLLIYYFVIKQEAKKERMNRDEVSADFDRK
jgi:hypothetical protein